LQAYINKYKIFLFISILYYIYYSNTSFFDVISFYLLWSSSIASPTNNNKKDRNIIMSDLLKESIADAKAVRETALANAKTFLEENFAASMKEMFADKLKEEMAEEADSEEDTIEEKLGSSNIGKDDGLTAKTQRPVKPSPVANRNTTAAGEQQFDAKLEEDADVEEGAEVTSQELDEILAELESEVSEDMGTDDMGSDDMGSDDMGSVPSASTDMEEVSLDELLAELEEEEAAPAAAAPVHSPLPVDPTAQQVPAPAPVVGQVPSPVAEGEDNEDGVSTEEMAEALVAINEENESLRKQLAESLRTVKYMRGVLSETNLLNAKLLYTNKLFKGKSLTEDQKLRIINTFDLTKNIREVKLAYTVLAESNNSGASVVKKKTNTTAHTITEGLASKQVSSTRPVSTIVEPQADEMTSRFQKLAGIKK
jgi:hypothetical protein